MVDVNIIGKVIYYATYFYIKSVSHKLFCSTQQDVMCVATKLFNRYHTNVFSFTFSVLTTSIYCILSNFFLEQGFSSNCRNYLSLYALPVDNYLFYHHLLPSTFILSLYQHSTSLLSYTVMSHINDLLRKLLLYFLCVVVFNQLENFFV